MGQDSTKEQVKVKEEYRKIRDFNEVHGLLRYFETDRVEVTMWQVQDGKRIAASGFIEQIGHMAKEMKLSFRLTSPIVCSGPIFKKELPLYLFSEHKKSIASTQIIYCGEGHLFTILPDEVHVLEPRNVRRICVDKLNKRISFSMQDFFFDYPVVDISATGVGVLVSKVAARKFSFQGDRVAITRLFNQDFDDPLIAEIRYCREDKAKNRYRLGLRFLEEIDLSLLDTDLQERLD